MTLDLVMFSAAINEECRCFGGCLCWWQLDRLLRVSFLRVNIEFCINSKGLVI